MFTSKLYVRNSHLCFMNWIIPSSRAIFVRRTTKIARELKTDKRSLQLKKKKPITRENIKYRDLKENIRTTHEKVKFQAGLSLITIILDWKLQSNFNTSCFLEIFFKNIVYNHISRYLTENMILSNNWFFIRDAECLLLADDTSIFYQKPKS